jgi:uncharacterized protein (DUF433 family)
VSELELLEEYPELEKEDFQAVFVSFRMISFASEK